MAKGTKISVTPTHEKNNLCRDFPREYERDNVAGRGQDSLFDATVGRAREEGTAQDLWWWCIGELEVR